MSDFKTILADFEVRYRFFDQKEGGRSGPAFQGYRCDWVYADILEANPKQAWMIWPIFIDETDKVVPEGTQVRREGTARMIIVNKELRESVHKARIHVGVKGYFVEGSKKVAEATIIRIVDQPKKN